MIDLKTNKMTKKSCISILTGSVLILSFVFTIISCNDRGVNRDKLKFDSDSLVAHFDYFTYEGDDDFYKSNPLPGEDYYYNPILPGWYSDPSVCTNGEDFFLVTSTFSYFPGVPLFHSKDLVNWKQIGHVLNRPEQLPLEGQRVSEGIFAPAISYNPRNKTYYMITTNIRRGNFLVKTKDPFGEWSDPVWLKDVRGIDPSLFFDDDGRAYIVNNDEPDGGSEYDGHRAIRVIEFDVDKETTVGKSIMLVNGGVNLSEKPIWIEGPHLYKINGSYYLMCAEGGTSINHREVIFKGNSPIGKFIPWNKNPILTQKQLSPDRPLPITCAGHADLIQKSNGQWWSVFLACRPNENHFENLGRETFLMPIRWSVDGFPYMTKRDEVIPRIIQMEGLKRDSLTTFGNFATKDEFELPKLGLEWMTLRGAANDLYSLIDNPGFLSIKCADIASNELRSPAFVSRRLQHHKFECTTKLYYKPQTETEKAGILMFKDETHQYLMDISKDKSGIKVSLRKIRKEGEDVLVSKSIESSKDNVMYLKVISDGKYFSFYFSENEDSWTLLTDGIDAFYLSTAQSYGFTGTNIGLYASNK